MHEEERVRDVHRGHPHEAAPANVPARAVVLDVHGREVARLPPEELGDVDELQGDVDGKSGKDGRRQAIAARYCVLAQMGDQLGDFADFFNPPGPAPASGRRLLPSTSRLVARWGAGWFILPNPVYGTGLGSGWDDTFPADRRWSQMPEGVK